MYKGYLIIVLCFFFFSKNYAIDLDSLEKETLLKMDQESSIESLNILSTNYLRSDTLKSKKYALTAIELSQKTGNVIGLIKSKESLARYYTEQGNYAEAEILLLELLDSYNDAKYDREMAAIHISLGNVYDITANFEKALSHYLEAENLFEKIGEQRGLGLSQMGIANIFNTIENHVEAKKYYRKSYENLLPIDEKYASWSLNNMALSMMALGENDSAIYCFEKSLAIKLKLNDLYGASFTYSDLGGLYANLGMDEKALNNYLKALEIKESLEGISEETIGGTHVKIGEHYFKLKDYANALIYLEKGVESSLKSGSLIYLTDAYRFLSASRYHLGDYKQAYLDMEQYSKYSDSLKELKNNESFIELRTKYETDQKDKDISLLNANLKVSQLEAEESDRKTQLVYIFLVAAGIIVVLVAVLGFSLYRSNVQKQKTNLLLSDTNNLILKQKHLVEEKQKEILDSIVYAKRIQEAILPSSKTLKTHLKDGFVLFKPKDVVSGDFYWLESIDEDVYFAAADCTGHGVPGAMVSVVCSNALSKALLEEGVRDTASLLNRTRDLVIHRFAKSDEDVKDGMDISLCCINRKSMTLQWSGANNPLWVVRNSNLIEYRPDKQPIGKFDNPQPFAAHVITLEKEDSIYVFTDGFQDQFGGEKGKKFKVASLKELLVSISHLSMDEQKLKLDQAFEIWRGDIEQVDDVCMIGVKVG